jgi:hypothetical protein
VDRARGVIGARFALLALALPLAAAAEPPFLLREQAWTAVSVDRAYAMTHAPAECLGARTGEVEAGRAMFRSPALLGGPAARAGLSCNACHANGRVNHHFLLPELTNRAGAADVTSEWSSRVRGDGVFNPVDIPDLADIENRSAFGAAREPSLDRFVRGVIVEEFQGQEPNEDVLRSVIAYVRALEGQACADADARITLQGAAEDVRRALAAAEGARDTATAALILRAAQDAMGRIVERLPPPRFQRARSELEQLSRELGGFRNTNDIQAALDVALPGWRTRFDSVITRIARQERRTYFNERQLRRDLR